MNSTELAKHILCSNLPDRWSFCLTVDHWWHHHMRYETWPAVTTYQLYLSEDAPGDNFTRISGETCDEVKAKFDEWRGTLPDLASLDLSSLDLSAGEVESQMEAIR